MCLKSQPHWERLTGVLQSSPISYYKTQYHYSMLYILSEVDWDALIHNIDFLSLTARIYFKCSSFVFFLSVIPAVSCDSILTKKLWRAFYIISTIKTTLLNIWILMCHQECPCIERVQGSSLLPVSVERKITLLAKHLNVFQVMQSYTIPVWSHFRIVKRWIFKTIVYSAFSWKHNTWSMKKIQDQELFLMVVSKMY